MNFQFVTTNKIIFGSGSLKRIKEHRHQLGKRCMVIFGSSKKRVIPLLKLLEKDSIQATIFQVDEEPTIEIMLKALDLAQNTDCRLHN
ncbi:MAG: iron-containing alcohol dehydrogenase [Desulfobacteraceae bacterium]|nr:iron-containing alcohol dehydrogenase [Desulfobacteraceae bacterium]